jgi:hypothetical protein
MLGVEQENLIYHNGSEVRISANGDIAIEVEATVKMALSKNGTKYKKYLIVRNNTIRKQIEEKYLNYKYKVLQVTYDAELEPQPFIYDKAIIDKIENEFNKPYAGVIRSNNINDEFVYVYNGNKFTFNVDPRVIRPKNNIYERTKAWGFPLKVVLYIPAVAIDIVTFPIQLFMVSKGLSNVDN